MKQLFVVGVGRSGTSLLQSMLAAHPAIAMLPETAFFRRYCAEARTLHIAPEALRNGDERLQRIQSRCWTRAAEIARRETHNPSWLPLSLYRALLSLEVAGCQAGVELSQVRYVGDKDPRLIEYLPLLEALFPCAHVVHIVRDPRDVLLSKAKAGWSAGRNWRMNLAAGKFQLDLVRRYKENGFQGRFHELRYEDLLSEPEATMRKLLWHIGLEYSPKVMEFPEAAARLSGDAIEEWKKDTLKPLNAANFGKWEKGLTAREIDACEGAFTTQLKRYEYQRSGPPSLRGWLYRALFSLGSGLYRAYRISLLRRRRGQIMRFLREFGREA